MIPYGRQDINQADIDAVVSVLRSDFLTQGPVVPRFEEAVAGYCGAARAVAVNSATSALHIACLALGLGPGDLLWTSPNTFVASANCALYCGANVDFVDIDPDTYNMSIDALQSKLTRARAEGRLPKIVIPVHFAGQPCDMEVMAGLARQYDFNIIEDASHAIGAEYQEEKIGNCRYSDITIFSFHPVKIITTGEGGVALTNSSALATRMSDLRSHGISRDPELFQGENEGAWYYEMLSLGFNYRLTDIQAALGLSQLHRIDDIITRRRFLAGRYDMLLQGSEFRLPTQMPYGKSAWHLYVIGCDRRHLELSRSRFFAELRAAGIGVNVHYIPVHLQPYYRCLGFNRGQFPAAESYYESALTIPLHARLSEQQQDHVVDALLKLNRGAKVDVS